jgi:hypothetical protein
MSDEPTPDERAPTVAPTTDETMTDEPATDEPATDEPATREPVTAAAKAPPTRSIARDVALVAVVFLAVFILLAGLLWLAVPSGERGATRASPISTLHSAADPTPVATAA